MEDKETPEEMFSGDDEGDLESRETSQADPTEDHMAEAAIIPEEPTEEDDDGDTATASEESGESQEEVLDVDEKPERENPLSALLQKSGIPLFWTFVQRHRGLSLGVTLGMLLVVGSSVLKWEVSREGPAIPLPPVQTYFRPAVSELTEIVGFERFILFPPGPDKAYVSVSISARTKDEAVYREIRAKKVWYRSLVYDVLTQTLMDQDFPGNDREMVGRKIVHSLNTALGRDGVEEILFGDVLEV